MLYVCEEHDCIAVCVGYSCPVCNELADKNSEIDELQGKLDELQGKLDELQGKLNEPNI